MMDEVANIKWKVVVLLLAWAVAFYPVVPAMVNAWLDHSENSHAFLVPLISLYLVGKKRQAIRCLPIRGSTPGLLFLVGCLAIYLVSFAGEVVFMTRLMLVAALIGSLWACLGTPLVRLLVFPLSFLFFMVPVPDSLLGIVSFPLQLVATKISAGIIQACSIPVYREGNMLYFMQTQLEVAEACSGIRSIMALTMLSFIFAYIFNGNWRQKMVLVLCAIPLALLANILRVSGTGVLAHFFGDRVARGFLHEFSGLVVFLFGMVMLCFVYKVLKVVL